MISILLRYIIGLFIGMLVMAMLSKSRLFYHINVIDADKIFNRKKQQKLSWML